MDKYEYQVHADQIKKLVAERRYAEAMNIADDIDWRKVRSVTMLQIVSEIYKFNKKYEEAREILLLAYDRHPEGRMIVYALCELAIKLKDYVQAKLLYEEYVRLAPEDTARYVLLYRLYEELDVSIEERIDLLEEFKIKDYRERWAYELALLYHKAGQETKCVEACDELILWFGEGKYVKKAMELKMKHTRLSKEQQLKYEGKEEPIPVADKFMNRSQMPVQQIYDTDPRAGGLQQIPMTPYDNNNSYNMDVKDSLFNNQFDAQVSNIYGNDTRDVQYAPGEDEFQDKNGFSGTEAESPDMQIYTEPVQKNIQHTTQMLSTSEIDKIEIQPVNVGMYNTMDLQNGLSENIKKFFESEQAKDIPTNVVHSADPQAYSKLYEEDAFEMTNSNGPVISVKPLDPSEKELDEIPGAEEDAQITTYMPMQESFVNNSENLYIDENPETEEYYEEPKQEPEETVEESAYEDELEEEPKQEPEEVVEESAYEDELEEEPKQEPEETVEESAYEDIQEEALGDTEKEQDKEMDPIIRNVYDNWEKMIKKNEERRIEEAKLASLLQTSDIMAQLKGVLPEINDIMSPVPSRSLNNKKPLIKLDESIGKDTGISEDLRAKEIDFSKNSEVTDNKDIVLSADSDEDEVEKAVKAAILMHDSNSVRDDSQNHIISEEDTDVLKNESNEEKKEKIVDENRAGLKEELKEEIKEELREEIKEEIKEELKERYQAEPEEEIEEEPEEEIEEEPEEEIEEEPEEEIEEEPEEEIEEEPEEEIEEEPEEEIEEEPEEEIEEEPEEEIEEEPEEEIKEESDSSYPEIVDFADEVLEDEEAKGKTEEIPVKEVVYEPEIEPVDIKTVEEAAITENDKNSDINDELYLKEIMEIEDPDDEAFKPDSGQTDKDQDGFSYSEDDEAVEKAAFEVTSELPKYPYEGLDDYGEVEEMEIIEQPDGLEGILKTEDMPIDEIARANYEAGIEFDYEDINEPVNVQKVREVVSKKRPGYMKLEKSPESKREFDEDEKIVFRKIEQITWLKAQIVDCLDTMSMEPSCGNVIVMGSESSGKRNIAINLVKIMQSTDVKFKGKVAKISGVALNKKDIPLTIKKLHKGALIIENAEDLTASSLRLVAEALELESEPVLVIMEGDKQKLSEIIGSSKEIMDRVFNARIDIKDYTIDDLVAYAKGYAAELGYVIDEMGVLALYRKAGELQTLEHNPTPDEVCEIVDNAIKHVDKKNMSHFMDLLLAKRYDKDDCIIIREKDFG
ncbi:MAG: hypothetical protein K6E98_07680 [Lachnospiraceae bacterium]|nr:hypothetical protein [Lachnospiraceae bacterium]